MLILCLCTFLLEIIQTTITGYYEKSPLTGGDLLFMAVVSSLIQINIEVVFRLIYVQLLMLVKKGPVFVIHFLIGLFTIDDQLTIPVPDSKTIFFADKPIFLQSIYKCLILF